METIKINKLEIENLKRIKAVKIEPTANGLTVVGGKNNQGKTSVLDSIAWALGGEKFRPDDPQREGSVIPPTLSITMSNGLVVERKGKNSDLKVTDPEGRKGGQQLLNEFVEVLALDLPKFMQSTSKEKAQILLQIIGVGDKLAELERKELEKFNQRTTIGRISDQKSKYAKEQPYYTDAPKELISASELIKQQQDILAKNGENQRKRDNALKLHAERNRLAEKVNSLREELEKYQKQLIQADADMTTAYKTSEQLQDESTAELESSISNVEQINRKVRANLDKEKAEEDALLYANQYAALTVEIEEIRQNKIDLLKGANLPLSGLSVVDGELTYNGFKWSNMSGSDQLKVSTAIVRRLNPRCGFVLLDKLEQMDIDTLNEFGVWLEAEGLQAIATRVSTGSECSIIIEDGYSVSEEPATNIPKWTEGDF
jgi:predicted ATP-dependent endonuclease of OLD family